MDDELLVGDLRLAAHWARPAGSGRAPAVVLSHGFPQPPRGRVASGITFPGFADRIARDAGYHVLTFNFRGTGGSDGDFSVPGWLEDQHAAIDAVCARDDVTGVWMVGAGFGGTLSICAAAADDRVRGVAAIAAPSDVDDWVREPTRFLAHARRMGVFRTPGFPTDPVAWARQIAELDPIGCARKLAPRPLLLLHGTDDLVVPWENGRVFADAHGDAELRVIPYAGHRLRHDPRAVASLLGWLDRQSV